MLALIFCCVARVVRTIEIGKRADLVLFDEDPLTRPAALLASRTVIKDGVVVVEHGPAVISGGS